MRYWGKNFGGVNFSGGVNDHVKGGMPTLAPGLQPCGPYNIELKFQYLFVVYYAIGNDENSFIFI